MLAFLTGSLTTFFDCYQTLKSRIVWMPRGMASDASVLALSIACGSIAAVTCWWSGLDPDSVFNTIVSWRLSDPQRGLVVGASVLTLIRSNLFNIKESPFGGDYLYQIARYHAVVRVDRKWTEFRQSYERANIVHALTDISFDETVASLIHDDIRARPDAFKVKAREILEATLAKRPDGAFDPGSRNWNLYYRALINVSPDICGANVVDRLPGFH